MTLVQSGNSKILSSLIGVSEKAGCIARTCRQDDHLLSLLVQEKKETEKNPRFIHDFKTLADVLVQEVVKHELCSKFPDLTGYIFGEENNHFDLENESITIEVKSNVDETTELLSKVLFDAQASKVLADVVHSELEKVECDIQIPSLPGNLGIWIDPIDSTAEYISGKIGDQGGKFVSGLHCVTVLIGVFNRTSGDPVIGVINQPFYKYEQGSWVGRYVYGICIDNFKSTKPEYPLNFSEKLIAMSFSDCDKIKQKLSQNGYTIVEVAGAGYKLLNIILGEVHAYVLSKPTTYLWDICAAHAILKSIGGDIIDYTSLKPIRYKGGVGISDSCNLGGIIAYRDNTVKENIVEILGLSVQN